MINTLIQDIYELVKTKGWFHDELASAFGLDVASRLQAHWGETEERPTLRMSQMGTRCPFALWNSIHHPERREPLQAWAEVKFSFGHILEALAVTLAKASGHRVEGEQDAVFIDGVKGHRDCIIDGCIVDVKSAATRSFQKFKDKSLATNDGFGYLEQLDAYTVGSFDDPLVTVKDRAYILAIDKQLGHMVLYEHRIREDHIRSRIADYKRIVALPEPPACECGTRAHGASGNIELDTRASYSEFKHTCFPQLRTFLYASGPVYLVNVAVRPQSHIVEVDRYGRIVYG